ncbi:hypothetical protein ACTQ50_05360 [Blautia sp. Sow4_E7]|uniref:hypothetical protein n=1 Tax=Blautia sp. Sow4_E7 TaxID=3438749 RepID=UPI003F8F3CCD
MERAHRELPDGERRVQRSIVNTSRSFAPNDFEIEEVSSGRAAAVHFRNPVGCDGVAYVIMPG